VPTCGKVDDAGVVPVGRDLQGRDLDLVRPEQPACQPGEQAGADLDGELGGRDRLAGRTPRDSTTGAQTNRHHQRTCARRTGRSRPLREERLRQHALVPEGVEVLNEPPGIASCARATTSAARGGTSTSTSGESGSTVDAV
jgi:hypothetical protein